jgi:hypothetical protein
VQTQKNVDFQKLSELLDQIKYDPSKVVNFQDLRDLFRSKIQ